MKKSSISGSRGAPSHKYIRVHNNLKSEDLLLEQKIFNFTISFI